MLAENQISAICAAGFGCQLSYFIAVCMQRTVVRKRRLFRAQALRDSLDAARFDAGEAFEFVGPSLQRVRSRLQGVVVDVVDGVCFDIVLAVRLMG